MNTLTKKFEEIEKLERKVELFSNTVESYRIIKEELQSGLARAITTEDKAVIERRRKAFLAARNLLSTAKEQRDKIIKKYEKLIK